MHIAGDDCMRRREDDPCHHCFSPWRQRAAALPFAPMNHMHNVLMHYAAMQRVAYLCSGLCDNVTGAEPRTHTERLCSGTLSVVEPQPMWPRHM
jgi:hypothetical protein